MRYNVGCLAALSGKRDEALRWLTDAVHHGLPPSVASAMDKDTDLVSLHGDPRFEALVTQAKAVAPHSSQ
jgi:hypothetical protein